MLMLHPGMFTDPESVPASDHLDPFQLIWGEGIASPLPLRLAINYGEESMAWDRALSKHNEAPARYERPGRIWYRICFGFWVEEK